MKLKHLNQWLSAFSQPTTYLGVIGIIIVFGGAFFFKQEEFNRAYEDGIQRGTNLTRVLEERASRIFYSTDSRLLLLRQLYQHGPKDFDLARWIDNSKLDDDPPVQFTIVGAAGQVLLSSHRSASPTANVRDQDYFRSQISSPIDDLFISTPEIDGTLKKTKIQLSRRLTKSDGSFNGIVLASLDVPRLDRLYNSLDVGQDGIVSLVGYDRIIRACGSNTKADKFIGRDVSASKLFQLYHQSSSGHFWSTSDAFCKADGIRRLISYRAVDRLHLLSVVGISEADLFRRASESAHAGWSRASFFVGIILVAIGIAATRERKLIAAKAALTQQARHDSLTGLANWQAFVDEIANTLSRRRANDEVFSVFMLDLDRFKDVNDSLGHPAGDALLKETARRLRSSLREADVLARFGGDEFAIIQRHESKNKNNIAKHREQYEFAIDLAERIVGCLAAPFEIEGTRINVGVSIGIALARDDNADSSELMKRADLALYRAKAEGANSYVVFDRKMAAQIEARQNLECELRKAISNNELELHYQPVIDVKTRKICSIEAFVRWRHPKMGLIRPREFMPVAEATDLIVPIGQWILQRACIDAIAWPPNIKVIVNVSSDAI